jgi:hypothetical protein
LERVWVGWWFSVGCVLGMSVEFPIGVVVVPRAGTGLVQLPISVVITLSCVGVGVVAEVASWVTLGVGSRSEVGRR